VKRLAKLLDEDPARLVVIFYNQSEIKYQQGLPIPKKCVMTQNKILYSNLSASSARGCYRHHVPAVCDEVNQRGEFLTAYAMDSGDTALDEMLSGYLAATTGYKESVMYKVAA